MEPGARTRFTPTPHTAGHSLRSAPAPQDCVPQYFLILPLSPWILPGNSVRVLSALPSSRKLLLGELPRKAMPPVPAMHQGSGCGAGCLEQIWTLGHTACGEWTNSLQFTEWFHILAGNSPACSKTNQGFTSSIIGLQLPFEGHCRDGREFLGQGYTSQWRGILPQIQLLEKKIHEKQLQSLRWAPQGELGSDPSSGLAVALSRLPHLCKPISSSVKWG